MGRKTHCNNMYQSVCIMITVIMFMVLSYCKEAERLLSYQSKFSWWMHTECLMADVPQTKPTNLALISSVGCYHPQSLLPYIVASPKSWLILSSYGSKKPCPKLYIATDFMINSAAHCEIWTWVLSHRSQACYQQTSTTWTMCASCSKNCQINNCV